MNIIYVSYGHLNSNSGLHIHHVANAMANMGHECAVFVPDRKQLGEKDGVRQFRTFNFDEIDSKESLFSNNEGPDIVHAWTPREIVRDFIESKILKKYKIPFLVHLEDNEEYILKKALNLPLDQYAHANIPKHLSHPVKYKQFINRSAGVTALIGKLLEFKPANLDSLVFWPGYDKIFRRSKKTNYDIREQLNIPVENKIIAYTGNCHHSNQDEIYSLYLAVYILNRKGISVTLVRTGKNYVELVDDRLEFLKENCVELGYVDRNMLTEILRAANFLVQPGKSGEFNDYRFPSKIPDFLISGKPVILPKSNIGNHLDDRVNCLLLKKGDALEIAQKVEWLTHHADDASKIGKRGEEFADTFLSWEKSALSLLRFYQDITQKHE